MIKPNELTIRMASETDAIAITKLAGELGYSNKAETIRRRLRAAAESDLLLLALDGSGEALGFAQGRRICVVVAGFWVEIAGLVVSEKARRAGLGRRLVEEIERWAGNLSVEAIVVRSNTQRKESHIFYPAIGYELSKTQTVYIKRFVN